MDIVKFDLLDYPQAVSKLSEYFWREFPRNDTNQWPTSNEMKYVFKKYFGITVGIQPAAKFGVMSMTEKDYLMFVLMYSGRLNE